VSLAGLATYAQVVFAPRRAFARLSDVPTWGWAALGGCVLTVAAVLLSERAQLHVLAITEAQRIAALPAGERLRAQMAANQIASARPALFIAGALVAPWVLWPLIAFFFFLAALVGNGRARLSLAWVTALNTYAVYGIAGVANAALVALHDPATAQGPDDLLRLPSPALLFPHAPALHAFFSAYTIGGLWYYAIVAIGLQSVMRMPRTQAIVATVIFSLLFGVLAALGGAGHP